MKKSEKEADNVQFFLAFGIVISVSVAIGLVLAIPVFFLWNWLMPVIFGLTKISMLQAFGLCVLSRFLFGTGQPTAKQ